MMKKLCAHASPETKVFMVARRISQEMGLPDDYPMAAPAYAELRAMIAKR